MTSPVQQVASTPPRILNLLDPELVEANRRGEVTPEQRAWFQADRGGMTRRWVLAELGAVLLLIAVEVVSRALQGRLRADGRAFLYVILAVVVVLLVLLAVRAWIRWRGMKPPADLQRGLVRQTSGELALGKKGYGIQAGQQRLSLPLSGNSGGLLPGLRYVVYYLEGSGTVLSAEHLGGSPEAVRRALSAILAGANRFSAEDLDANRRGEMTRSQKKQVLRPAFAVGLPLILLGAGCGVVFAATGLLEGNTWVLVGALAIAGLFLVVGGWAIWNGIVDTRSGRIESVEGTATLFVETQQNPGIGGQVVSYFYNIADAKIRVSRLGYLALISGLRYRASYTRRSKRLLSIELLDIPEFSDSGD